MHFLKDLHRSEQGQTIAVIIFIMILALGIGVSISSRFIKRLRISTQVDASNRAATIAEAGVERMLINSYNDILDFINFGCGADCVLSVTGADGVVATANITLSIVGDSTDAYEVALKQDETIEVSLLGYADTTNVNVCWDNPPSGDVPSVTGFLIYGTDGNYQASSFGYNSIGSIYGANGFDEATAGFGYNNCGVVSSLTDPVALRIKSVYNDMRAFVVPSSGENMPNQGILIESTGTVLDSSRKVEVVLSNPYLPIPFDYVLYSKSATSPLSN